MVPALQRPGDDQDLLKTEIVITARGRHHGRRGWISGTFPDRAARGITRAIVKFCDGTKPELLAVSSLEAIDDRQGDLFYSDDRLD